MQNDKSTPIPCAIIGGGAAGMFAAAVAADRGFKTLVIERKTRLGSKVLMTANGRCNFTKDISPEVFLRDVGSPVAGFIETAIKECPPTHIAAGLRAVGVNIKRMQDGRLFPASEKAADIVHAFGDRLRDKDVPILNNAPVLAIKRISQGFRIQLDGFTLEARNVLLATGGLSFPKTGSVGDGQTFAQSLGHTLEPYRAGLTGFLLNSVPRNSSFPRPTRFENATARIIINGKVQCVYTGEVEFEPTRVTGAAVYNCQRWVARNNVTNFTLELQAGTQHWQLTNPKAGPLKEAIVTIGGVARSEVDPHTMQSRICPDLYFAGEVLDIDGPTGGYNLTMAFATARLAITSMIKQK